MCNFFVGFDFVYLDKIIVGFGNCFVDSFSIFGFIFGMNNIGLVFLFGLFNDEVCFFGILLCNLFLFDGFGEFFVECYVSDGYIFESNVEFVGMFYKVGLDLVGDSFMLGDEFGGIELGNDRFEDFVIDGGEYMFIIILVELLYEKMLVFSLISILIYMCKDEFGRFWGEFEYWVCGVF